MDDLIVLIQSMAVTRLGLICDKKEWIHIGDEIRICIAKTNSLGCKRYSIVFDAPAKYAILRERNYKKP